MAPWSMKSSIETAGSCIYGNGPTDAIMVNTADWLLELKYVDFIRDVGRHFSVNRMLDRVDGDPHGFIPDGMHGDLEPSGIGSSHDRGQLG